MTTLPLRFGKKGIWHIDEQQTKAHWSQNTPVQEKFKQTVPIAEDRYTAAQVTGQSTLGEGQ